MLITSLTVILLLFYALIAGFAVFMTFDERSRTGGSRGLLMTSVSVLACLVWPVTVVVVMLVMILRQIVPAPQKQPKPEPQTAG